MKKVVQTDKAPKAIGPYSQGIVAGDFLFVSGQAPINPTTMKLVEGGVEAEAVQVMKNLKNILAASGLDFSNVVKTTVFLTDMNNFALVNDIYRSYFDNEPPARSCVAVVALPMGALVEIEVIAQR